MEKVNEKKFSITEAKNFSIIGKALDEIDALIEKMGGEIIAPIIIPAMVEASLSIVKLSLAFRTKDLHEYATQSPAQVGDKPQV